MPVKDKKIDTLPITSSQQFDLFGIGDSNGPEHRYSNTIELYDALPKYNWSPQREFHDLKDAQITRTARLRGQEYKIIIKPAILNKKGKSVLIYPGTREEVVEDVLRKFAVSGQGQMREDNAGVMFTLSQLRNELKAMNHAYDIAEIKEAIMVCRGATIECYGDDDQTLISSNFFPLVGLTTRQKYLNGASDNDARCYVMFNPMVTKSILDLSFRQYDYKLGMEIPSPLARFIYKRMSHYWTQASLSNPYTPALVSFLSQSPRGLSDDMYSNTRAMNNALKVLIKHKVVSRYDEDIQRVKRKVIDIRYKIYPHEDFVKMVKSANYHFNQIRIQADIEQIKTKAKRGRTTTKRLPNKSDPGTIDMQ